jgi:CRP/FNR family transcriptional regulator, cyclic AMP receptor protein
MSAGELSGYLAAALVFLTFYMKTMVPLRVIGICSNCAFIIYGYVGGLYPVLILHLILLPLNSLRLREMLKLTQQVRDTTHGDLNVMDWLKPFATSRRVQAGEVLFNRGDVASDMFVVVSGRFRLAETGIEIEPPNLVGEFALLAPERSRTQTLECVEEGTLLQIGYGQVEQLFFQNPKFCYYFLRLITQRLFQNIARLETELARCRQALGS